MHSWSSRKGYEKAGPSEAVLILWSLDHMVQEGNLLKLKVVNNGVRKFAEMSAANKPEAGDWFDAVEASLRSMSMQIEYSLENTDIFQHAVLQELQYFVDHCFIPKCMRDRRYGVVPNALQVTKVVRVQNSTLLNAYPPGSGYGGLPPFGGGTPWRVGRGSAPGDAAYLEVAWFLE